MHRDSFQATPTSILAWGLRLAELRLPAASAWLRRRFIEWGVPAHRAIGLRVVQVAHDSSIVDVRLPLRRRNTNVGGTVHGGVLLVLAESVHGIAVLWQFPPATHTMVTKESRIEFVAPGRGQLTVRFHLEPALCTRVRADLDQRGRCELALDSTVTDERGQDIARLRGTYVIRRRIAAADGRSNRARSRGVRG